MHRQEPDSGAGPPNPEDPDFQATPQDLKEADVARDAEDNREMAPGAATVWAAGYCLIASDPCFCTKTWCCDCLSLLEMGLMRRSCRIDASLVQAPCFHIARQIQKMCFYDTHPEAKPCLMSQYLIELLGRAPLLLSASAATFDRSQKSKLA